MRPKGQSTQTPLRNWGRGASLAPFVLWLALTQALAQAEQWQGNMDAAIAAHRRGDHERALLALETALGNAGDFAPNDPRLVQTYLGLGAVYYDLEDYEKAVTPLETAYELASGLTGEDQVFLGTTANSLGLVYRQLFRFEESERLLLEARVVLAEVFGADHIRSGQVTGNLAVLYQMDGRLQESETYYRQAIPVYEGFFGPTHSETGQLLEGFQALLFVLGKTEEAEALEDRLAKIREPGQ